MANVGQELLDVPFPQMIKSMGMGIAQAQFELDQMSLRLAQMMSGEDFEVEEEGEDGARKTIKHDGVKVKFGGEDLSLLELGFTPTFYQFVDTIIEVKMSISMASESSSSTSSFQASIEAKGSVGFFSAKASAKVSSVSASYASKYSYSAEGSSLIRTKLVPVPPPAVLEERIRRLMEKNA